MHACPRSGEPRRLASNDIAPSCGRDRSQWGRRTEQRRSEITTALRLIDVQILDHLVIIAGETVSMAARGLL
ncbi:JAB domain-containing protein [Dyella nitratireducens]|uniref:JAB domain-containing protein n=1 Tax=Dyella nitratireducens TaxID=1849580 RepID=UPI003CCCAE8D